MEQLALTDAMIASGIVLAVTFIAIFTELVHGMERSKVAAAGALTMVIVGQIYGFYSPMEAVEAVDWNVIFLLAAMMTIVSIMIPTGGFGWLAYKLAAFSKGRLYLMLVLLGTAVTVLSLLLDNVTTVVIFGPADHPDREGAEDQSDSLPPGGGTTFRYGWHRHARGRSPEHHDRLGRGHFIQRLRDPHGATGRRGLARGPLLSQVRLPQRAGC